MLRVSKLTQILAGIWIEKANQKLRSEISGLGQHQMDCTNETYHHYNENLDNNEVIQYPIVIITFQ